MYKDWYDRTFTDHIYQIAVFDSEQLTKTTYTLSFFDIFLCYIGLINPKEVNIIYDSSQTTTHPHFYEIKYCDGTSYLTKTFDITEQKKPNITKVDKYIIATLFGHNIAYFINKYYNSLVKDQFTTDEIFVYVFFEKQWSKHQLAKALLNKAQIELYVINNDDMFEEGVCRGVLC